MKEPMIAQILRRRDEIERAIIAMVHDFEDETGVLIEEILISPMLGEEQRGAVRLSFPYTGTGPKVARLIRLVDTMEGYDNGSK